MKRPGEVRENVLLAPLTVYRIGGPAQFYARPGERESLQEILAWAWEVELPIFILGAGSNLLVSDRGFDGLVIHFQGFQDQYGDPTPSGEWEIGAGAMLSRWVRHTVSRGYAGLEALIGIPGTIGGGLRMNAGAFSMEISQPLISVDIINRKGEIEALDSGTIGFLYRRAPGLESCIILGARFRLTPGDRQKLLAHVREVISMRRNRQPLKWPSCGSVFKRPEGDFAGRLIEAAGLKGISKGAAQVSPQHANFIVNRGGATSGDILYLIKKVKKRVFETSGVWLKREVILVGFSEEELEGA